MCLGLRLAKQEDYFWVNLKSSIVFWGSWGSSVNWLEPKIEPPSANLACLNLWNTLLGSISWTFYEPHLYLQIPRVEKNTDDLTECLNIWDLPVSKLLVNMLVQSASVLNFINILHTAFMIIDPKSVKIYWWLDWVLTLWGATGIIAVWKYADEINPRNQRQNATV